MRFIALLRGVNVGGRTVKMDALRACFGAMGFGAVQTYIQSGNVVFDANEDEAKAPLNGRIEAGLKEAFGFEIPTVLLTPEELSGILAANPFAGRVLQEGQRVYITISREPPSAEFVESLLPDPRSADEFSLIGRAVYVLCHGGYHETAYSNTFFEKKLKAACTTRNLEVLGKLMQLA